MAAITKNRNFFKWPKLLYFKPESAQFLAWQPCWLKVGITGHNLEVGYPRTIPPKFGCN
jgi:hypothetical protein